MGGIGTCVGHVHPTCPMEFRPGLQRGTHLSLLSLCIGDGEVSYSTDGTIGRQTLQCSASSSNRNAIVCAQFWSDTSNESSTSALVLRTGAAVPAPSTDSTHKTNATSHAARNLPAAAVLGAWSMYTPFSFGAGPPRAARPPRTITKHTVRTTQNSQTQCCGPHTPRATRRRRRWGPGPYATSPASAPPPRAARPRAHRARGRRCVG